MQVFAVLSLKYVEHNLELNKKLVAKGIFLKYPNNEY